VIATAGWIHGLAPQRRRAVRDGLLIAGFIFNLTFVLFWTSRFAWFVDAPSWWTIDLSDLYGRAEQSLTAVGAFRMAPVVAWIMYPLTLLSWPWFVTVYLGLNLAAVAALGRRWAPALILCFPPVLLELANANIHLFMALAVWAGMRWPGAWSVLLLTKVTPGIGVVWFAARREWRNLALALGTTAIVVGVGFVIAPGLWSEWVRALALQAQMAQVGDLPSLVIRLPIAAAVVWFAARTDRAWLVPIGCLLAMPTIWLQSTALLAACFPLYWERARWQRAPLAQQPASGRSMTEAI
jgi:hypothetical protein